MIANIKFKALEDLKMTRAEEMIDHEECEGIKCAVTDRADFIDDCYIEIQFGYGSDKDMWTYKFGDDKGAVHDSVGKKVLEAIQSMMPEGRSVESFGENTIAENFDENWWEKLTKDEKAKYRRDWGLE